MASISAPMSRRILPLFLAIAAAGCSNIVETRVSSSGVAGLTPTTLSYDKDMSKTPELQLAYANVVEKLSQRGFKIADGGDAHLELSIASRPAALAVSAGGNTISSAKKRKALQSCADKEYRLLVVLTRISDGGELYRGSAAEYHCNMPLADILPHLIDTALADLAAPRGNYMLSRRARD